MYSIYNSFPMRQFQICLSLLLFIILLTGCNLNTQQKFSKYDLAVSKREYLIGTTGYAPPNFPDNSDEDIKNYWKDIMRSGELYGIHTDWNNTNLIDLAASQINNDLVVVLGFQTSDEWQNSASDLCRKIRGYLDEFPQIKYLGIGNEINNLYIKDNEGFVDYFMPAYKQVYETIKEEYSDINIFPTFQYESLKGGTYISGKTNATWGLIKNLDDYMDLIVITTYPYFDIKNPENIPDDYFNEIGEYSDKLLAISKTGWMSRQIFGGALKIISDQGYAGSESEQIEYLKRLTEILDNEKVEFVNWAFLNDIHNWHDGDSPIEFEVFDSIGLKYNDGSKKEVWDLWLDLVNL